MVMDHTCWKLGTLRELYHLYKTKSFKCYITLDLCAIKCYQMEEHSANKINLDHFIKIKC